MRPTCLWDTGQSRLGRDLDSGCSRSERWGRSFDLTEKKQQEAGENFVLKSFITPNIISTMKLEKWDERSKWHLWRDACVNGFIDRLERKREFWKPTLRTVDNIKMDFKDIRRIRLNWIRLAQNIEEWRDFVYMVRNMWVRVENFLHSFRPVSYYETTLFHGLGWLAGWLVS